MSGPGRREYAALAAISSSGGMNLLVPLYLAHLGYPVAAVGLLAGLGALAVLLSRIPVPMVYRPERSRALLLIAAGGGMVSSAVLPFLTDLAPFTLVLLVNRALSGLATAVYLARYLDLIGEGADRRRAMGNYGGTQALGYTLSGVFVGILADFLGYHAAFLYGAAMSALGGLLLLGAPNPRPRRAAHAARAPARPQGGLRGRLAGMADPGLWGVLNANTWNNFFHIVQASFFPVLATAAGLGPAQVGLTRAVYAGINTVGRPTAGIVMGRFTLRQVAYLGLVGQAAMLFALPFVHEFALFMALSVASGLGRAIVVVASSAGLAEDVDETRVSRGTATAAYSTSSDVPNVVGPLVAGFIASVAGLGPMFAIVGVGTVACFAAGDLAVARWRARRPAEPAATLGTR
jgi:MFS family permease